MSGVRPKLVIGVVAVAGSLLTISLVQEMNRRWQVQREVQGLEADVKTAERKVIELEQLNQYFRTDAFQERLARESLNYSAPGEKVVLIPEEAVPTEAQSGKVAQKTTLNSMALKWWKVFFVNDPASH